MNGSAGGAANAASGDPRDGAGAMGSATTPAAGGVASNAAPPSANFAVGLTVSEVAVFQGIKVSVAKNGSKVLTRPMPVIAGRSGMIRVYVKPDATWTTREATAVLHLTRDGQPLSDLEDTKTIATASTDADLASTFDFDVPGSSLAAGVTYAVQLLDKTAPAVLTPTSNPAQYPVSGAGESLDAVTGADKLNVVVVPVRYGADGSNRVPDTGAAIVDSLRSRTLELYPVPAVDITVHAPIDFSGKIAADGSGWATVLTAITQLRLAEKPAPDVYYYGAFAPAATVNAYCPNGCVLGLSNVATSVSDASQRASVGVLYNDPIVIGTMPHEVGHAHGRYHAPCGNVAGPDANFPYANATIGAWGFSIVSKKLFDPGPASGSSSSNLPHDFMSYCSPVWTSDYTFKALFERGQALASTRIANLGPALSARPLRVLLEDERGSLAWSGQPPTVSDEPLAGDVHLVAYLNGEGSTLGASTAHRYEFDHLGGGYWLVPDGPAGTALLRIDGVGDLAAP